jgi:2-methylcitrate dehydratase PrpD
MGGKPESTLLAVGGKCSSAVAAFANAELMNGLDMDAVSHIPPIVFPALMAVAEAKKVSGKDFLAALTVSQEVSKRIGLGLGAMGAKPEVSGNSNEYIIGAALGCSLLLGLDEDRIRQAMGIAAYYCSLPVNRDWEKTEPKSMIKYVPVSWLAQGGVQAAKLAALGYTGNPYALDSEFGFSKFYICKDVWEPEKVLNGIGETWLFPNYHYKPYPCCTITHSSLDSFSALQEKHHFAPDEISEIRNYSQKFVAHPDQYLITNQVDLQFSIPYCIALIAMGYKPGPAWQDKKALTDPALHKLMRKVKIEVAPEAMEYRKKYPGSMYSRVEVDARGQTFVEETVFIKGTNNTGFPFTDEEFVDMYRTCSSYILPDIKIERSIDMLWHLEDLPSLDVLMENLSL